MKIGLVGLLYENNLGDPLMLTCVEALFKKEDPDLSFSCIDLFGRLDNTSLWCEMIPSKKEKIFIFMFRLLSRATRKHMPYINNYVEDKKMEIDPNGIKRLKSYYAEVLKDVDCIVIVGGALVKYQLIRNFHIPLYNMIDTASYLNKNVYFNAVGVENGYDIKFHGCKIVKKYLNYPNVKFISTRDDIETLKKFVDDEKRTRLVSDSAIWVDEIFNMKVMDSDCIGIGVIDPIRFAQYGQQIKPDEYELWLITLLNLLTKAQIKWKLFCNGHIGDYEFILRLIKKMQLSEDYTVKRPLNHIELIHIINSFQMIVASRLHACIIAYGLNKQVIGLDWNDKLLFFAKQIHAEESFFKPHKKTPKEAFYLIKKLQKEEYDQTYRAIYRNIIKDNIKQILIEAKMEAAL